MKKTVFSGLFVAALLAALWVIFIRGEDKEMPLIVNGVAMDRVIVNGVDMDQVVVNSTTVWTRKSDLLADQKSVTGTTVRGYRNVSTSTSLNTTSATFSPNPPTALTTAPAAITELKGFYDEIKTAPSPASDKLWIYLYSSDSGYTVSDIWTSVDITGDFGSGTETKTRTRSSQFTYNGYDATDGYSWYTTATSGDSLGIVNGNTYEVKFTK